MCIEGRRGVSRGEGRGGAFGGAIKAYGHEMYRKKEAKQALDWLGVRGAAPARVLLVGPAKTQMIPRIAAIAPHEVENDAAVLERIAREASTEDVLAALHAWAVFPNT